MNFSEITFRPNDKVIRINSDLGECLKGDKVYINDVSPTGKYVEIVSRRGRYINTGVDMVLACNFKLVMTCKVKQ